MSTSIVPFKSKTTKYVVLGTQSDSTVLELTLGDSVLSRAQHSMLAALISLCAKATNEFLRWFVYLQDYQGCCLKECANLWLTLFQGAWTGLLPKWKPVASLDARSEATVCELKFIIAFHWLHLHASSRKNNLFIIV